MEASSQAAREVRTFCNVLLYTGCRISEALALTTRDIDLSAKVIVFESLKKRRSGVYRQVPIPAELLDLLDIREIQNKGKAGHSERLWPWCRMTALRKVEAVIKEVAKGDCLLFIS